MDRRTSVEQYFSRMKDANGNDMSRGFVRVTLAVVLQAVAANISELETWAARYGDERAPGHRPLSSHATYSWSGTSRGRRGPGTAGVAPRASHSHGCRSCVTPSTRKSPGFPGDFCGSSRGFSR